VRGFARVARNFALKRLGREGARTVRERAGAKDERLPSASEVLEREEARAQVVRALLDVAEPYRTTLLLRFYENMEPRDIAKLQRVPGSTVRNRLRRGLELLRARLERDLGDGWRQRCVLVLPLVPALPGPTAATTAATNGTTGGGLVLEKISLAAAAVLAAGGLVLTWTWSSSGGGESASKAPSLSGELAASEGGSPGDVAGASAEPELASAGAERSRERAASAPDYELDANANLGCALHGRLLGPDGQPLKPEQLLLRTQLDRVRAVELASGESPGPGAPNLDLFVRAEGARTAVDDLDLEVKSERPILDGIPVVEQFFLDASVGIEDAAPSAPRLVIANESGEVLETSIDGAGGFRFDGLRPARWHLYAEAPGCQSKRIDLEIAAGDRDKSLDVALDAVVRLKVKLVTPDGKELRDAILAESGLGAAFLPTPFALRAPPGERTPALAADYTRRYGSGRWSPRSDEDAEALGDASGVLELHDPLPLHVGVSASGVVLESRLVPPGAGEVVFVIAPERIRALPATLALRILSADSGRPIAGAIAGIEGLDCLGDLATDAGGALEFKQVPPGRRLLRLHADGFESRAEWIDVAPGARTDAGSISLRRPVAIAGHAFDGAGGPIGANIELIPLDGGAPGSSPPIAGTTDSGNGGAFRFDAVAGGRYLLVFAEGELKAEAMRIDTREGPGRGPGPDGAGPDGGRPHVPRRAAPRRDLPAGAGGRDGDPHRGVRWLGAARAPPGQGRVPGETRRRRAGPLDEARHRERGRSLQHLREPAVPVAPPIRGDRESLPTSRTPLE
jgi:hypothetical protein